MLLRVAICLIHVASDTRRLVHFIGLNREVSFSGGNPSLLLQIFSVSSPFTFWKALVNKYFALAFRLKNLPDARFSYLMDHKAVKSFRSSLFEFVIASLEEKAYNLCYLMLCENYHLVYAGL